MSGEYTPIDQIETFTLNLLSQSSPIDVRESVLKEIIKRMEDFYLVKIASLGEYY